jgi:mono/diheme cytochrome c family protein
MRKLLVLACLLPLIPAAFGAAADTGDMQAGKAAWDARGCKNCHGNQGEGGFGPDLAGRQLSVDQFKHAVRKPWGVMPAFTDRQITDQNISDVAGYLRSLPAVAEPAAWRVPPPPADAPKGQIALINFGCAQCHQPELADPRKQLGGEAGEVNFELFSKLIYTHTDTYPEGRMGNFQRNRLTESTLQDIFKFVSQDLGLMPNVVAEIRPGKQDGGNTTYTVTLKNSGKKEKGGLTAEDLTISLPLAKGTPVVSGTGDGYKGVQKDAKGNDMAVWQVAKSAPEDAQTFTITVTGNGMPADVFKGAMVRWSKPEIRKGAPNLAVKDARMPGKDAQTPVAFPTGERGRG